MKRFLSVLLCAVLVCMLLPAVSPNVSAESLTHFNIRLNEPVASRMPDFSPEFNTDVRLYSSVTWQENSPGFNGKLNSSDEFRAGLAYKVEIWIRLGDGNYLATDSYGDLAAALTVNGKAISSLKIEDRDAQGRINEVTITCEYDPLPGREISSVLIKGIPTPVAGNMPIYSFTIESSSYDFYHTAPVVWWDMTTGEELDSSDIFIQGHKYQVNIWIQANRDGGFTFKTDSNGDPQVNATLNSWAADSVTTAYEQEGREVIDIRYTLAPCAAAHTCSPKLVPLQKQTCVLPGFKAYYECSCGKCYEDAAGKKLITDMDGYGIIPADGHKEGAWSYDGSYHYKECTTCHEEIPGTKAAHTGGTASCIKQAQCTTCGASYGKQDSEHRWGPGWDYKDAKGHAWVCADCKTHSEVFAHTPGPAATDTKAQTCTDCGYVLTPAKNHVHKLTEVEERAATCTAVGNIRYFICDDCDSLFADEEGKQVLTDSVFLPMLEHQASEDWSNDDTQHWKVCQLCQQQLPETVQLHEVDGNGCAVCFYEFAPTEQTDPTVAPPAPNNDGDSDWAIFLMIGLIFLGVAIVAAVLLYKKKGDKK